MDKQQLIEKLMIVSGYKPNATGAIYGSIDLPGFKIAASSFDSGPFQSGIPTRQDNQFSTLAERDTKKRFDKFKIKSLTGKTVLDIGCNTGAIAFEACNRGASLVIGIDIVEPQIEIANEIARYTAISDKVKFFTFDINTMTIEDLENLSGIKFFDVCFCLSLDLWVKNRQYLYDLMNKATKETLYFESNKRHRSVNVCTDEIKAMGFATVEYVGACEDQAASYAPARLNFIAQKNIL